MSVPNPQSSMDGTSGSNRKGGVEWRSGVGKERKELFHQTKSNGGKSWIWNAEDDAGRKYSVQTFYVGKKFFFPSNFTDYVSVQ